VANEVGTASNLEDMFTRILRFLEGRPSIGTPAYAGTGDGTLWSPDTLMGAPAETWTLTATSSTSFSVTGSVSGAQAAATVGVEYSNAFVKLLLLAGSTAFVAGDQFTFAVAASTLPTIERWQALRLYRDNLAGITTALTQPDGTAQARNILHSFRYDPRSLGWDADNTNANGYCTVTGYAAGSTVVIQLRAPREVASVRLQSPNNDSVTGQMLQNFVLEYSDDGSTWTGALTVASNPTYALAEAKTFAVGGSPGAHRWWRITVNRRVDGNVGSLSWKSLLLLDSGGLPVNHYGSEVLLKATGPGGTDAIYTGIRSEYHAGTGWYNLFLNGYTGFNVLETSWFKQPGALPHFGSPVGVSQLSQPMIPLWNQPMPYWFAANGRSFRMGAKVSTSFVGGYLGWILPYATPSQYPYPLAIGGSMVPHSTSRGTPWRFSFNSQLNSVFTIPACGSSPATATESVSTSLYLRLPDGQWGFVGNRYGSAADPDAITNMERDQGQRRGLWPTSFRNRPGSSSSRRDFRECLGGGYITEPLIIHQRLPQPAVLGELEGVFCVSGFGNASENTFTLGGVDHVVLQNIARTEAHEYWALALNP
jgi:hypothetical protein